MSSNPPDKEVPQIFFTALHDIELDVLSRHEEADLQARLEARGLVSPAPPSGIEDTPARKAMRHRIAVARWRRYEKGLPAPPGVREWPPPKPKGL